MSADPESKTDSPVSPSSPTSILVVDDETEFCRFVEDCLQAEGYSVTSCHDGATALDRLPGEFDAVLCDYHMKGLNGIEVISRAKQRAPNVPMIMITAFGSVDHAVQAMQSGADDYLTKPVTLSDLRLRVRRAVETRGLRREVARLRSLAEDRFSLDGVLGRTPGMQKIVATIRQLERSLSNVLISGESGTGKELVARAIHHNSPVGTGPFVPVNCAAIPEQLLESELFGHVRGAFTDARADKAGLFHEADGGTLFLDEIGEMSPSLQAKLLRILEEGVVRRIGATEENRVNVRVLSATNRDLEGEIDGGDFRADLYYRLNVVELRIPPLRERRGDIAVLMDHFLGELAGEGEPARPSDAARSLLFDYDWPGNARQLRNALEHAVALSGKHELDVDDFPTSLRAARRPAPAGDGLDSIDPSLTLSQLEDLYIEKVLDRTGGNRSAAAAILGIDRKTLYKRLQKRRVRS